MVIKMKKDRDDKNYEIDYPILVLKTTAIIMWVFVLIALFAILIHLVMKYC